MQKEMHVFGGFKTWQGANNAAQRLIEEARIPHANVGIILAEEAKDKLGVVEEHTRAAEGASVGGIAGGVLGGLIAGLTAAATIAIPGLGLLVAGPLAAALAGVGAGAAAGGALGGLIGLGLSEQEIKHYETLLKTNGLLVTVTTYDKDVRDRAKRILVDSGALNVETDVGRVVHVGVSPSDTLP